jgi:hypothetical protein
LEKIRENLLFLPAIFTIVYNSPHIRNTSCTWSCTEALFREVSLTRQYVAATYCCIGLMWLVAWLYTQSDFLQRLVLQLLSPSVCRPLEKNPE